MAIAVAFQLVYTPYYILALVPFAGIIDIRTSRRFYYQCLHPILLSNLLATLAKEILRASEYILAELMR